MRAVVLDASVVLQWFRDEGERHVEEARALRAGFETGAVRVLAPRLLNLEVLNVAGRSWGLREPALVALAVTLSTLRFEWREPEYTRVATWVDRGLTAYDASYVTVAEAEGVDLVTGDAELPKLAPGIATPLA